LLVSVVLLAVPAAAEAGGLYVPGIGPTSSSRAGAFVATADDPSAVAINPAGLAKGEGITVLVGVNFLDYSLDFQRRGTYDASDDADLPWAGDPYPEQHNDATPPVGIGSFQALPLIAVSIDLDEQVKGLHVGAGVYVPNSYPTRDFGSDYVIDDPNTPPPPSRYDTVTQEAAIVLPSIAVAYRINDQLDVGGRASWGFADIKASTYTWGFPNYDEWTGQDSLFDLHAKDNFVPAFGLGVLYRVNDMIELGAAWDSQVDVHAKGSGTATTPSGLTLDPMIGPVDDADARCATGGTADEFKACINIGLPMVTTIGGRYKLLDAAGQPVGDVELNVAWERWSAVSDHNVTVDAKTILGALNDTQIVHNLDDAISIRLGGGYRLPVGDGLTVRGGLAYDTAAAPKNWERLDMDGAARTFLALGVAYPFGKFAVQAGGGYVYEGSREVGTDCNTTDEMPTCTGQVRDPEDRDGPDPAQPVFPPPGNENPFNAGRYESSYIVLNVGVIATF